MVAGHARGSGALGVKPRAFFQNMTPGFDSCEYPNRAKSGDPENGGVLRLCVKPGNGQPQTQTPHPRRSQGPPPVLQLRAASGLREAQARRSSGAQRPTCTPCARRDDVGWANPEATAGFYPPDSVWVPS